MACGTAFFPRFQCALCRRFYCSGGGCRISVCFQGNGHGAAWDPASAGLCSLRPGRFREPGLAQKEYNCCFRCGRGRSRGAAAVLTTPIYHVDGRSGWFRARGAAAFLLQGLALIGGVAEVDGDEWGVGAGAVDAHAVEHGAGTAAARRQVGVAVGDEYGFVAHRQKSDGQAMGLVVFIVIAASAGDARGLVAVQGQDDFGVAAVEGLGPAVAAGHYGRDGVDADAAGPRATAVPVGGDGTKHALGAATGVAGGAVQDDGVAGGVDAALQPGHVGAEQAGKAVVRVDDECTNTARGLALPLQGGDDAGLVAGECAAEPAHKRGCVYVYGVFVHFGAKIRLPPQVWVCGGLGMRGKRNLWRGPFEACGSAPAERPRSFRCLLCVPTLRSRLLQLMGPRH